MRNVFKGVDAFCNDREDNDTGAAYEEKSTCTVIYNGLCYVRGVLRLRRQSGGRNSYGTLCGQGGEAAAGDF